MEASVIIPTYQSWGDLQECLDCLAAQTIDPDRFEVLVVNNDPDDVVPNSLRLPANARILAEAKPGSYAARNCGIAAAKANLLFFTDADCRPDPEYLNNGIRTAEEHPDTGRFGGDVVLFPNGKDWTAPELFDRHLGLEQKKWVARGRAVTANLVVRRSVLEHVGPFNDAVLSGGDMEWNDRATKAGEPILFAEDVVVGHPARKSLSEHVTKARRIEGARLRRNAKRGALNYIPPIHKIFPSFKTLFKLAKESDLNLRQALGVWGVHYVVRVAKITETIRLLWLKRPDQRK